MKTLLINNTKSLKKRKKYQKYTHSLNQKTFEKMEELIERDKLDKYIIKNYGRNFWLNMIRFNVI